jgi:hypothetical protein
VRIINRKNPSTGWPIGVSIFGWAGTLIAIGVVLANCGGGSTPMQLRQLIAITVQPSNGDTIVPGTLPFTASGTFNQPPTTQTNLAARWTSSNSSVATVDPNTGLASCVAVGGPITITASVPGNGGSTLSASAMLNCLSHPGGELGQCQLVNNTLTGSCLGVRGGICREAYDPNNCPPGQPPISQGQFLCGSSGNFNVDGTRDCTP